MIRLSKLGYVTRVDGVIMKKSVTIVAAAMAGMLGFGGVALAAGPYPVIPSPTIRDMTFFTLATYEGNDNPDADPWAKLETNASVQSYKDAVAYADTFDIDNVDDEANAAIFNIIEGDNAVCHEIVPLVFSEYDGGALNVRATFPTDFNYLLVKKVAVFISVLNANNEVVNYVVQGEVTDQGVVVFHINGECAEAVANGTAYIGVFSAE
jgi:hypothetical protein